MSWDYPTFYRLQWQWGVRVPGDKPRFGDLVTVTRKNAQQVDVILTGVVQRDPEEKKPAWICTFLPVPASEPQALNPETVRWEDPW